MSKRPIKLHWRGETGEAPLCKRTLASGSPLKCTSDRQKVTCVQCRRCLLDADRARAGARTARQTQHWHAGMHEEFIRTK